MMTLRLVAPLVGLLPVLALACTNDASLGEREKNAAPSGEDAGPVRGGEPSTDAAGAETSTGKDFEITGSVGGYDVGASSNSAASFVYKERPGAGGNWAGGSVRVSTLTDVCAASSSPTPDGHRALEFIVRRGTSTGTFEATDFPLGDAEPRPGTIVVIFDSSSGRAIADRPKGTVTVTHFATLPGETTDLTFDVTFETTGERLAGTVRAPFCTTL